MTKECTLKEAWLEIKLNKLQPDWMKGKDVTQATKEKIIKAAKDKYQGVLDEAHCITIGSIEKTLVRLRKKKGIIAESAKKDTNSRKNVSPTVQDTLKEEKDIKINVSPETKAILDMLCMTYRLKDYNVAILSAIEDSLLLEPELISFYGGKTPNLEDWAIREREPPKEK